MKRKLVSLPQKSALNILQSSIQLFEDTLQKSFRPALKKSKYLKGYESAYDFLSIIYSKIEEKQDINIPLCYLGFDYQGYDDTKKNKKIVFSFEFINPQVKADWKVGTDLGNMKNIKTICFSITSITGTTNTPISYVKIDASNNFFHLTYLCLQTLIKCNRNYETTANSIYFDDVDNDYLKHFETGLTYHTDKYLDIYNPVDKVIDNILQIYFKTIAKGKNNLKFTELAGGTGRNMTKVLSAHHQRISRYRISDISSDGLMNMYINGFARLKGIVDLKIYDEITDQVLIDKFALFAQLAEYDFKYKPYFKNSECIDSPSSGDRCQLEIGKIDIKNMDSNFLKDSDVVIECGGGNWALGFKVDEVWGYTKKVMDNLNPGGIFILVTTFKPVLSTVYLQERGIEVRCFKKNKRNFYILRNSLKK
ncbi:MAG: hypothetical protein GY730_01140 [bacterium]|nr:hypothetical protein [bacterium]